MLGLLYLDATSFSKSSTEPSYREELLQDPLCYHIAKKSCHKIHCLLLQGCVSARKIPMLPQGNVSYCHKENVFPSLAAMMLSSFVARILLRRLGLVARRLTSLVARILPQRIGSCRNEVLERIESCRKEAVEWIGSCRKEVVESSCKDIVERIVSYHKEILVIRM